MEHNGTEWDRLWAAVCGHVMRIVGGSYPVSWKDCASGNRGAVKRAVDEVGIDDMG